LPRNHCCPELKTLPHTTAVDVAKFLII